MKDPALLEAKTVAQEELRRIQAGVADRIPVEQSQSWASFAASQGTPLALSVVLFDGEKPLATASFYEYQMRGIQYLWARRGPVWFRRPSPDREAEGLIALREFVAAERPRTAFLRLHAWYSQPFLTDPLRVIGYDRTAVIDGGRGLEETALAAMPSVGRKLVRRAGKLFSEAGGTIQEETGLSPESFAEHYSLLAETAHRDGFTPHDLDYYAQLLHHLGPAHARLFTARVQGELACWDLVVVNGKNSGAMYGASSELSRRTKAAVLLDFEVAVRMGAEGRDGLDLMGVHSPRIPELYDVGRYKLQFTGSYTDVPGLWDMPVHQAVSFGLRAAFKGRDAMRRLRSGLER